VVLTQLRRLLGNYQLLLRKHDWIIFGHILQDLDCDTVYRRQNHVDATNYNNTQIIE
jgi:hypothetical protein